MAPEFGLIPSRPRGPSIGSDFAVTDINQGVNGREGNRKEKSPTLIFLIDCPFLVGTTA
jgi:hypothetical protein